MTTRDETYPARVRASVLDVRRALCAVPVTLNGEPARIVGASLDFATVLDVRTGLGAEWAWATVEHVIEHGGAFES